MNGEIASDNIFMPEAANKFVCGSSWGWLVLEGTDSRQVSLLNPFTRRVIRLPSLDTFTCEPDVPVKGFNYIHKAILSTNPTISEKDCIILAIVGRKRKLSYCKIGDKKWRNIDCCFGKFCDVIYYNGKCYAITDYGYLVSCDLIDTNFTKTIFLAPPIDSLYPRRKHLVMASGRLLLLYKTRNDRFKFHLLNKCSPSALNHEWQYNWVEKNSIGDQLLFIGNNGSFSLPAQSNSSRANCIYFTENAFGWVESNHDDNRSFGMYDIAKEKFNNGEARNEVFRSFWMIPSPW
ncbi:F-box protein SKIP23-like protein [Carex littledalei]|uniref:F-box protein SKIP23-like protein n=1 Tax=Carex littledalei TaxID=544730 RepID=A0A833R0Q1_9POAL|nr:F-box protein SKIP23-like protein [Carex littledalei]